MAPSADDKKYATDTRKWSDGVIADGVYDRWEDSPISNMLKMKDICIYKAGTPKPGVVLTEENFRDPDLYDVLPDVNKNSKWNKTSWDSFSYALLMGHNVWMHLTAVQEANRRFDAGEHPAMMQRDGGDYEYFEDIVEEIFSAPDKASAMAVIERPGYTGKNGYWNQIVGTRGFKGKNTTNSHSQFNALFEYEQTEQEDFDASKLDNLEAMT